MKKIYYSFLLLLLIAVSCNTPEQSNNIKSTDKLDEKMFPYEHEYLKLFGGDPSKEQIAVYKKSIKQEQSKATQRSDIFGGEWTLQGPGNIGGRVNAIATEKDNADVIYAGFARGGLWKTEDGGANWVSLWEDGTSQAVSAIAIDPNNSDIVYAGTGDVNITSNVFTGDGLYKSEDGGASWNYIGLNETYIIGDIIINPENTDKIMVATMGFPFQPDNNRGIYITEDGGETWTQSLFVADNTGVHDLAFHPENPNVVLAASWTRIRNQFESEISGPDCNVYISEDFGQSWNLINLDTPFEKGRPAVCFSQTDPLVAYAMIISANSYFESLHKTIDGGQSWMKIDEADDEKPIMMGGFAWFFGRIESIVDPFSGVEKLYLCGVDLWSYNKANNEWFMETPHWAEYAVHADKHAILKDADGNILLGTDGGLYRNNGTDWEDIENIPNNMFYRVAYNPHDSDNYYGGMQDNGTSGGNAEDINLWPRILGGDGFQVRFNPDDPNKVYAETQRGVIYYSDDGGFYFSFIGLPEFVNDRKAWDMQYILSPHNPDIIYFGTYRGVKMTNFDGAFEGEAITGELTDEPEFITHVVTALDESILEEGLLYFGTSDGNVWRVENGQEVSIATNLPDLYVTSIKASPYHEDHVYVTFSGYNLNDNAARIFKSTDRGETWESISGDLPIGAVNDIVIYDEYQDSILFAATNAGVYATIDAGQNWSRLGNTLPIIPVNDMDINVDKNELIAGTYGRSINTYPIDSIEAKFNEVISFTKDYTSLELAIYPNPAVDYIAVEAENIRNVELISTNGALLFTQPYNSGDKLDVSQLNSGIYYIRVKSNDGKKGVKPFTKI